jgi:hypothetical protein
MGNAKKVPLSFSKYGPPHFRRLIAGDLELLDEQPDYGLERHTP